MTVLFFLTKKIKSYFSSRPMEILFEIDAGKKVYFFNFTSDRFRGKEDATTIRQNEIKGKKYLYILYIQNIESTSKYRSSSKVLSRSGEWIWRRWNFIHIHTHPHIYFFFESFTSRVTSGFKRVMCIVYWKTKEKQNAHSYSIFFFIT